MAKRSILVSRELNELTLDDDTVIQNCLLEHGMSFNGSGAGFGAREMDFEFDDDEVQFNEEDLENIEVGLRSLLNDDTIVISFNE